MKRNLILLVLGFLFYGNLNAQILQPGDIAFVAFSTSNPDRFSFVTLTDLTGNVQIKFTDNGWSAADTFFTNEETCTWTSPPFLVLAGTVINIDTSGMVNYGTVSGRLNNLSSSGEQVFAYQKSGSTITHIAAMATGTWLATCNSIGTGNTTTSCLPTSLTNGINALSFATQQSNGYYIGSFTSGTKAQLLQALNNPANWLRSSTVQNWPNFNFTVSGNPTVTSIAFSQSSMTVSEDVGSVKVQLKATANVLGNQTIKIIMLPNTLTFGNDFNVNPAFVNDTMVISIPNGKDSTSFIINVINDTIIEPTETVSFRIVEVLGGAGITSPSDFLFSVLDNDTLAVTGNGIVFYNFDGSAGNEPTYPATVIGSHIYPSQMNRGSGTNPSSATNAFSAIGWNSATIDMSDWFGFDIATDSAYVISMDSLTFEERKSATGPMFFALRSSLDGFTANLLTDSLPSNTNARNRKLNFSTPLKVMKPIEFRIYAWGASASTGTWRIDNVRLFGSANLTSATQMIRFSKKTDTIQENKTGYKITMPLTGSAAGTQSVTIKLLPQTATYNTHYTTLPSGSTGSFALSIPTILANVEFDVMPVNLTGAQPLRVVQFIIQNPSAQTWVGSPDTMTLVIKDATGVGVSTMNQLSLKLFPNPAKDYLYISGASLSNQSKITLYDMHGRVVKTHANYDLNNPVYISDLAKGVYMCEISVPQEGVSIFKIVKD